MDRSSDDAVVPDVFDAGAVEILSRQSGVAGKRAKLRTHSQRPRAKYKHGRFQLEKPVFNSYVSDMYGMYIEYDKPGFTEIKSQVENLNATKSNRFNDSELLTIIITTRCRF